VRLDPKAKVLHYNLGLIYEKLGEVDLALQQYRTCFELETNERERLNLAKTIKRLEGARGAVKRVTTPPARDSAAPARRGEASIHPAAYGLVGAGVAALGVGFGLAASAAAADPGKAPRTGDGVTLEQLEGDAEQAHAMAVGADVVFAVGSAATVAGAVVAVLSLTGGEIEANEEDRGTGRLMVGPTGAVFQWRW